MSFKGILVGYSDTIYFRIKYLPELNLLLISSNVNFQEHDEDGKSYDNISRSKPCEFEGLQRFLKDLVAPNSPWVNRAIVRMVCSIALGSTMSSRKRLFLLLSVILLPNHGKK